MTTATHQFKFAGAIGKVWKIEGQEDWVHWSNCSFHVSSVKGKLKQAIINAKPVLKTN